jgi:translation initiation factor IF-2
MERLRVYELSKKLNVSNKDIIAELSKLGIKGKIHSSSIDPDVAVKVEKKFKKAPKKKETVKKVAKKEAKKEPAKKVAIKPPKGKKKKPSGKARTEPAKKPKEKTQKERSVKKQKPIAQQKPERKKATKRPPKKVMGPVIPSLVEDEGEMPLLDKLEDGVIDEKADKLKSKSRNRAFQAIRKIEPKRWIEPKGLKKGGRARFQYSRRHVSTPQQPVVSTAAPRKKAIKIPEGATVKEFSESIGLKVSEVIKKFMELGSMVTINESIDMVAAALVADSFDIKVEVSPIEEDVLEVEEEVKERPEDLFPRPPVVTVMGHVDHGKTSLLDSIRESRVTETEAGGITQHIGAYEVNLKGKDIVFLDTPGHEAFTTMRARGAQSTDIVVLVVAADDGVMPQTVEAINHAKAAGVPIIVAVNKIDKPEANPQKVRTVLGEYDIVPEEWGGKNIFVDVSAKEQIGIDDLLEMILLQSEMMELKANPQRDAKGIIIESRLDKGRGPVGTVLVQTGTLRVGDAFLSGTTFGKVRALINDRFKRIPEAIPSTPVEVIGFSEVPKAGDHFAVAENERRAKQIAFARQHKERLVEISKAKKVKLDDLYAQIQEGQIKELNIIIKADVQGSVEAIGGALEKITHPEVMVRIIHSAVGGINESDVMLAAASNAIIIGFNVRPESKAWQAAENENVDIELYTVIYEAIEDVRKALEGLLEPTLREQIMGRAEVRETYTISRIGTVAGCYVLDGMMQRSSDGIRVIRDNIIVHQGKISSLKRFKEDVREVQSGYECGILLENFNDIKNGDIIENFVIEKIATKL